MRTSPWLAFGALLLPLPALAEDRSDAYKAGYNAGRQAALVMGPLLPYLGAALVALTIWLGWRAWSRRRSADRRN